MSACGLSAGTTPTGATSSLTLDDGAEGPPRCPAGCRREGEDDGHEDPAALSNDGSPHFFFCDSGSNCGFQAWTRAAASRPASPSGAAWSWSL